MGGADVHRALGKLTALLDAANIPYATSALRGDRGAFLPLPRLLELKLASGMSAPHRLKDLADVLELVRAVSLPRSIADDLDPSVRAKFLELWEAAQAEERE